MRPVRRLEHAQEARHPDRAAADHRVEIARRAAVGANEQIAGHRRRRGLAAVITPHHAACRVEMQQECAAADARRLRLHQIEHQLHRNRRVDRAAALLEYPRAGTRGMGVGGDNHLAPRACLCLVLQPGTGFRLNSLVLGKHRRGGGEGGGEHPNYCRFFHRRILEHVFS